MKKLADVFFLAIFFWFGVAGACKCQPQAAQETPRSAQSRPSIAQVVATPQQFQRERLELQGQLRNEGRNYFTDLRVVLQDEQGRKLRVRPWLPVEVLAPPGAGKRPDVLSNYLGKQVRLTAVLEKGVLKHVGETYYLSVKTAKVVE